MLNFLQFRTEEESPCILRSEDTSPIPGEAEQPIATTSASGGREMSVAFSEDAVCQEEAGQGQDVTPSASI
jgi:hypothetical protein